MAIGRMSSPSLRFASAFAWWRASSSALCFCRICKARRSSAAASRFFRLRGRTTRPDSLRLTSAVGGGNLPRRQRQRLLRRLALRVVRHSFRRRQRQGLYRQGRQRKRTWRAQLRPPRYRLPSDRTAPSQWKSRLVAWHCPAAALALDQARAASVGGTHPRPSYARSRPRDEGRREDASGRGE